MTSNRKCLAKLITKVEVYILNSCCEINIFTLRCENILYQYTGTLTSDTFINLISTPRPSHEISAKVLDWFVEYIRESHTREASLQEMW